MSDEAVRILIGAAGGEHVAVLAPRGIDATADWLSVDVEFRSGAFEGAFRCNMRAAELAALKVALTRVKTELVACDWRTLEDNIALKLTPDRRGGIAVEVGLSDDPAWRRLSFEMAIDQSFLPG